MGKHFYTSTGSLSGTFLFLLILLVRLFFLIFLILPASGVLSSCRENKKEEIVTLKMIYPGTQADRMKEFIANEFNSRLEKELNMRLELHYISWDQYFDRKDIMIAAGEQIDLYWDAASHYNRSIADDGAQPLNDPLDKYGPDIRRLIPAENFKPFMNRGDILAIPVQYAPTSEKFRSILVRQDLLEEAGMTTIETLEDFEMYASRVKAGHPDIDVLAEDLMPVLIRYYSEGSIILDTDIYIIAFDERTRRVFCTYETEYFEKSSKKQREWNRKGWVPEKVAIKLKGHRIDTGDYLAMQGGIARPLDFTLQLRQNVPTGKLAEYLLLPHKPRYKWFASTELIFVPKTAVYPEKAVRFINWIYKSKENYRFCIYGVEGKDWDLENGKVKKLTPTPFFSEWMFQNITYMDFPLHVDEKVIRKFKEWDNGALRSAKYGFMFDVTPVHEIGLRLAAVYWEKILPISAGFLDYDENITEALAALKEAGINEYVAEYQRQYDEWQKKH